MNKECPNLLLPGKMGYDGLRQADLHSAARIFTGQHAPKNSPTRLRMPGYPNNQDGLAVRNQK